MLTVTIHAPSRLHFGLYSFGCGVPQYGGVGVMIDRPGLTLRVSPSPSDRLEVRGHHTERTQAFVDRWHRLEGREVDSVCVELVESAPQHQGLGLGTSLGMSVAAGLRAFYGLAPADAATLAASVGRGRRSAVGAHGFCLGGFIAEAGRPAKPSAPETEAPETEVPEIATLSPLQSRVEGPSEWRFVLIQPPEAPGISGESEVDAFARLPPVIAATRSQLIDIATQRLLPSVEDRNFPLFAVALYDYGRLAGECFAAVQGGPYRGPVVTEVVEQLRAWGCLGVGQSSWGPTIYAAAATEDQARVLVSKLQQWRPELQVTIAAIANRGAQIDVQDDAELG